VTCARCSRPHDNWPDAQSDGCLCQECWEAQCSREWWAVVRMIDAAGLMEPAAEKAKPVTSPTDNTRTII